MKILVLILLLSVLGLQAIEDRDIGADLPVMVSDTIDWTGYADTEELVTLTFVYTGEGVPKRQLMAIIANNRRLIEMAWNKGKRIHFLVTDEEHRPLILRSL